MSRSGIADRVGDAQLAAALVEQVDGERVERRSAGRSAAGSAASSSSKSRTAVTWRPRSKSVVTSSRAAVRWSRRGCGVEMSVGFPELTEACSSLSAAIGPPPKGLYLQIQRCRRAARRGRIHGPHAAARLRGDRADPSPPLSVPARRSHHRVRARQADRRHQERHAQRALSRASRRARRRCCRRRS